MFAAFWAVLATAVPTSTAAPETPVHLGLVFKLTHIAEMEALRLAQQDPRAPEFRRWLTPDQFGRRFGQPDALLARAETWLRANGFEITTYPNRSFIEAQGTAAGVYQLLAVQLLGLAGAPAAVHVPDRSPRLPPWLGDQLLEISGLDTRVRFHHRLWTSNGSPALGPQDLRAQYDVIPVLDAGFYGQGQQLVVLSEAEAPGNEVQPADIAWFYQNLSDATATFNQRVMTNLEGDFDLEVDGRLEFELDPEMQSVGSPGAESITLEVAPASQVFILGAQDIVNNLSEATAVSVSLGVCEPSEAAAADPDLKPMQQAVTQGTMEGQTWSAATGDFGADDCQLGLPPATVDFPSVIPEIVAMGGSQIVPVTLDQNIAVSAPEIEQVWNDFELVGAGGGGGGGGLSTLFTAPDYQTGLGFTARSVPDLALISGAPYTIAVTSQPGILDSIEGTSIAAPLSAGFFGLMASALGCRLGDPHALLYQLGEAQLDGGGSVIFNDIVTGDNSVDGVTGFTAAAGYDSASGWGSMDVAALLKAWPACPSDAGTSVPGTPGPSYSQCAFLGCDAGCTTLPQGPSSCSFEGCNPDSDAGQCSFGSICTSEGPYAANGDAGACIPGCLTDADCSDGGVCDQCYQVCVSAGTSTAQIGDPCTSPDDCLPGATCLGWLGYYDAGYCSAFCDPSGANAACDCPDNSSCGPMVDQDGDPFFVCLASCLDGGGCSRPGYVCQIEDPNPPSCQPACSAGFPESCEIYSVASTTCDLQNGVCEPPTGTTTAGAGTTGTSSGGATSAGRTSGGVTSGSGTASGTAAGTGGGVTGAAATGTAGATSAGTAGGSTGNAGASSSGTGTTGGPSDSGRGITSTGSITVKTGCGCSPVTGSPDGFLGLAAAFGLKRRRRRAQSQDRA